MNIQLAGSILGVFLVLGVSVYAQDMTLNAEDSVRRMTTELNMTDAQADAVRPIIKEYMSKRDAILQEMQGDLIVNHAVLKSTLEALRRDEYLKLSKTLSEDQMKRWVRKENLRASLNKGGGESQIEGGTTLTPEGAKFNF
ncbi:MAG: hypothetical protein HQL14_00475 [Candidatus Omnitrophica bacterium]|nr:hypothetical protein [Candidatus Omnitrophota bacterium]